MIFKLGLLLMDELQRAVALYLPNSAGGDNLLFQALQIYRSFLLERGTRNCGLSGSRQRGGLVVIPEGLDPSELLALEPLISDADRIEEIRKWEESQLNPTFQEDWTRPDERKISQMASIEKRIEEALRKRSTDRTISQYRESWRRTAFVSHKSNRSVQGKSLGQMLKETEITNHPARIVTAVDSGVLRLERLDPSQ